jgi:hypothetical protein
MARNRSNDSMGASDLPALLARLRLGLAKRDGKIAANQRPALDIEVARVDTSGVLSKADLPHLRFAHWPETTVPYLGVLVSALLLLRAPFCSTTLSSLNLRPLLAGKQGSAGGSCPSR